MLQIVVVDDEVVEREGVIFLIEKFSLNLSVIQFSDGEEALNYIKKYPVDILLTDVRMPFMDGLELTRNARELYPDLKIIIFSGYGEFEYAKMAISLGVRDYILKPVNPKEFKNIMENVINEVDKRKNEIQDKKRSIYVEKEYIITNLINGMTLDSLKKKLDLQKEIDFMNEYKRMILIEVDNDFFQEHPKFLMEIESDMKQYLDYINLNPHQSVLLVGRNGQDIDLAKMCNELHKRIYSAYSSKCYFAISEPFETVKEIYNEFLKLEHRMEERFSIPDYYVFHADKVAALNQQISTTIMNKRHEVELVKEYIYKNYSRDLSLETLADHVYVTPSYLSSLFKKDTGMGLNNFIKNYRMEKAKDMLKSTNMKIRDIGNKVGYSNISYFCESFRVFYGVTPEKYRQAEERNE